MSSENEAPILAEFQQYFDSMATAAVTHCCAALSKGDSPIQPIPVTRVSDIIGGAVNLIL